MSSAVHVPERLATPANSASHSRANVLGVKVSAIDMDTALAIADRWIHNGQPGYVCVTGVHGVMEAQRDPSLLAALNNGVMNLPDGMPMSWVGWLQGYHDMNRVFGPDFMNEFCKLSVARGYRHFLYGGESGVADLLKTRLESAFPGIQVVGVFTPPFRPLLRAEDRRLFALVRNIRPDIIWVGLGTPKQEKFMVQYVNRLSVPLMVGVGAAFDYQTGRIRDCPAWVKRAGMQWLHRLLQDPYRLWRRYFRNNPAFVWKIVLQFLHRGRSPELPALDTDMPDPHKVTRGNSADNPLTDF